MLGTKRVEAVIVSWQLAAGRRYCQWCLALAGPGDAALTLRFNCARLSLYAVQFEQQLRWVTQLSSLSSTSAAPQPGEDSCWA